MYNSRQSYLHKIVHVILAHRQLRCCVRHFLRTLCENGRKPTRGLHRVTSEKRGARANATALTTLADSRTFSHRIAHRTTIRTLNTYNTILYSTSKTISRTPGQRLCIATTRMLDLRRCAYRKESRSRTNDNPRTKRECKNNN